MIYLPVLGALALGVGTIIQKTILNKRKIDIKLYQTIEFLAIVGAMLPFIYFFWGFNSEAFELKNIFILVLVIGFSIIANLFVFYSMKWEKVTRLEPAKILEPLFTVLLAIVFSFFFSEMFERELHVIIPTIIAVGALLFANVRKHHLRFNKYMIAAVLGSFFFALELVLSKLILNFYSPMTFYLFRCVGILAFSLIFFKHKFSNVDKKSAWLVGILGFVWVTYRVFVYYGYLMLGVTFTTLLILLGPVFVYLFAWIFLKEKINWRNIIASVVIVASVLYVVLG